MSARDAPFQFSQVQYRAKRAGPEIELRSGGCEQTKSLAGGVFSNPPRVATGKSDWADVCFDDGFVPVGAAGGALTQQQPELVKLAACWVAFFAQQECGAAICGPLAQQARSCRTGRMQQQGAALTVPTKTASVVIAAMICRSRFMTLSFSALTMKMASVFQQCICYAVAAVPVLS